eukprot:Hpha_TRINITY_DN15768_c1_g1::TRINITY_DN15768_c1_g1_i2::g.40539::m.40539
MPRRRLLARESAVGEELAVSRETDAREGSGLGDGFKCSGVEGDNKGLTGLPVQSREHQQTVILSASRGEHPGLGREPVGPRPHLGYLRTTADIVLHHTHVPERGRAGEPGVGPEVAVLPRLERRVDNGVIGLHSLVSDDLARHLLVLVKREVEARHRILRGLVTEVLVLHHRHVGLGSLEGIGRESGDVDDNAGLHLVRVDCVDIVQLMGRGQVPHESLATVQRHNVESIVDVVVAGYVEVDEHLRSERETLHLYRERHARHDRVVHGQPVRVHVGSRPHLRRPEVLTVGLHLGLSVDGIDYYTVLHVLQVHLLPV